MNISKEPKKSLNSSILDLKMKISHKPKRMFTKKPKTHDGVKNVTEIDDFVTFDPEKS